MFLSIWLRVLWKDTAYNTPQYPLLSKAFIAMLLFTFIHFPHSNLFLIQGIKQPPSVLSESAVSVVFFLILRLKRWVACSSNPHSGNVLSKISHTLIGNCLADETSQISAELVWPLSFCVNYFRSCEHGGGWRASRYYVGLGP